MTFHRLKVPSLVWHSLCFCETACRTARTQRAEPAPPSRRPAGSAGGAPSGKPGRRVPLGAHSGPAPRFGSPFGRSLMAERSDLVNVYSPLRGRSARRRRFSLIINAELQTRRNQPAPQCSPGGASPCEATGGHERRNVSGSRARWPRINLRMSRRPPPARRPGAPAPSARGPEAPPARLAPGTLGARGSAPRTIWAAAPSGFSRFLLHSRFGRKPSRPSSGPGRGVESDPRSWEPAASARGLRAARPGPSPGLSTRAALAPAFQPLGLVFPGKGMETRLEALFLQPLTKNNCACF
uniref:serine/arginine repetitive matrix protein 3-like n=1 Tax=Callithrix jacchus TaxID=9483 RepID=UPI0023DCEF13|nr:serine/arginine repetitive matrix protein 3-like [Callithrix jacchus]